MLLSAIHLIPVFRCVQNHVDLASNDGLLDEKHRLARSERRREASGMLVALLLSKVLPVGYLCKVVKQIAEIALRLKRLLALLEMFHI